jgi:UrcA family protein
MSLKILLAAGAALALCAPAFAESPMTRIADGYAVTYADLDLDTEAGQDELAARIDNAIRRTCMVQAHRSLSQMTICRRELRVEVAATANAEVRVALENAARRNT